MIHKENTQLGQQIKDILKWTFLLFHIKSTLMNILLIMGGVYYFSYCKKS